LDAICPPTPLLIEDDDDDDDVELLNKLGIEVLVVQVGLSTIIDLICCFNF